MKRDFKTLSVSLSAFIFLVASAGRADNLTVSAAISLKPALEEIAKAYGKETKNKLAFNFGASGTLERQIESGAPVDVFISAASKQVEELESKGLILPGTKRVLLENSLVLVVPTGKSGISRFEDLTKASIKKIAVGDPKTVPAGQYAAEVFEKLNLTKAISAKLVTAENVRQVLTYVETGNVDAGVVYLTDALGSRAVSLAARAEPSWHSPIVYPIAVLKATKHEVAAKAFENYLSIREATQIFQKRGFIVGSNQK